MYKLALFAALLPALSLADGLLVPKQQFVAEFPAALAESFCAEKSYFSQCFEPGAEPCKETALKAAKECMSETEAQLPAQFQQPVDGQAWGHKLGTCAGEKFEAARAASLKASADCKDATKWQ